MWYDAYGFVSQKVLSKKPVNIFNSKVVVYPNYVSYKNTYRSTTFI